MSYPRKVSDGVLLASYARNQSVWKVADEVGICGQSVHERLVKLGVTNPVNRFTDAERDRLTADYAAYRAAGRVSDLAQELGRTVQFLSRQARELGLTDAAHSKIWHGKWKHMSDAAARILFDSFKASKLGLLQWCAKNGYDDEGFRDTMRGRWPDEWEPVIESKTPLSSMYRLGRALEYRVRDKLKVNGYVAMRSPASKSPIDIIGIKPGQVLFIQCKRGGALVPKEWNAIYDLAMSAGAIPVMAEQPYPRCIKFWRMTARKDGSRRRQPMEEFDIDPVGSAS